MNSPQVLQNGLIGLISQSGLTAKIVLLVLLASSVMSWAIIFTKWLSFKRALHENRDFLDVFWNGKSIDDIFNKSDQYTRSPVAAVFKSGFKELKKITSTGEHRIEELGIDNVSRALARAANSEVASLEKYVSWLATTASAAPFIGLFGTVWGIMNSFQSIGATGAANLAVVAPGISEALITTATGIAAAIPAVVAYNHFVNTIKRVAVEMDGFSQDFLNIIQRSAMTGKKGS